MDRTIVRLLTFLILFDIAGSCQELFGKWQGIFRANGREARTVIEISRTPAGDFKATMYYVDIVVPGTPGSAKVQGLRVKLSFPGVGATYEGVLSADGKSINGTWAQGPEPLHLELDRATPETAWAIKEAPATAKPMAADADPAFEVATIKPSLSEEHLAIMVVGRRFTTTASSVSDLISFAYGLNARQIIGLPSSVGGEKFDVIAQPDKEGQPNGQQLRSMVQKLLADRFKLVFHRDKKTLSVYRIVVTTSGHKLTNLSSNQNGIPVVGFRGRRGAMTVRNATISDFAGFLQRYVLDRPVVDQTGIAQRYDFTLDWNPNDPQSMDNSTEIFGPVDVQGTAPKNFDDLPDLFTAMRQQLGLTLESVRAPIDVVMIDQVEKPSPN